MDIGTFKEPESVLLSFSIGGKSIHCFGDIKPN